METDRTTPLTNNLEARKILMNKNINPEELGKRLTDFAGELDKKMGIRFTYASSEKLCAEMPVHTNTQVFGILHGGASAVLIETVGSLASYLHAGLDKKVVGISIHVNHIKSVDSGTVTAICTPVHLGKTLTTHNVVVTSEDNKTIAVGRMQCIILNQEKK